MGRLHSTDAYGLGRCVVDDEVTGCVINGGHSELPLGGRYPSNHSEYALGEGEIAASVTK